MPSAERAPEVLGCGNTHIGGVVRLGDTVRPPRTAGAELAEAFLLHLESVGFPGAPRFLGVDAALSDDTADYIELGADAVGPRVPGSFDAAVARHRFLAAWWRAQPAV